MHISKIKSFNILPFSGQTDIKEEKATNVSGSNSQTVASVAAADAIKAKNAPKANKYTFLQNINLPYLNLNANLYVLPNGQKCLIAKKEGPCVLKTFFKVGSMNEPDNLRGISHYIEHNLFNGSENLKPTEFVSKVNKMGGRYNASTGFICTDYFIQSPLLKDTDLENFIKMHADMLSKPKFLQEMLDKERGPVISEIQMLSDNPYNIATNVALKNLFGIQTTSGDLIGGNVSNIRNITREDVVNYYQQNYNPKTALTVVIGDVDEKKTLDLLCENFKDFKAPEKIAQKHEKLVPIDKSVRRDYYSDNTQSNVIQLAFAGPKTEKEKDAMSLLVFALTGYRNARLVEAMRKINLSIDGSSETISNEKNAPNVYMFSTSTSSNNEEDVLKLIYQKIHEMAYTPMSQKELDLIRKMVKNNYNYMAESNMGISSLLGSEYILTGNFDGLKNRDNDLAKITPEDIMNVARKYLDLNKVSICVVHPKNKANVSFAGKIKKDYDIKSYRTSNNAQISTLNAPNSKLCSLYFELSSDIPEPKVGLNAILSNMLSRGTSEMSERDFNNIECENNIGRLAGVRSGVIYFDYACPKESLDIVLSNFHKNLYSPALTVENFEKAKQSIKNVYYASPKSALDRAVEILYQGTERAYSARKVIENIDNITFDDVLKFYKAKIENAGLQVFVTGDLGDDAVLNKISSSISANGKTYSKKDLSPACDVKELTKTQVVSDTQERNQADILQMYRIKGTGNVRDIVALKLLNEILGGNSNSRLFNDLREKQKLAYRVSSSYSSSKNHEGVLSLRIFSTTDDKDNPKQSENLQKSINGFNYHIQKLINEKVSQEELEAAKLQLKSNMLFDLESTSAKNTLLLASMKSYYKKEYLRSLFDAIDSMTVDDIQTIAKHYLTKPSVISIVASKKTIEENKDYLNSLGEFKAY